MYENTARLANQTCGFREIAALAVAVALGGRAVLCQCDAIGRTLWENMFLPIKPQEVGET